MYIAAEATYTRGDTYETDMSKQIEAIMDAGADAVISVGAYQACAAFIRDARKAGFEGPIANISFVGSEALLNLLLDQQRQDGKDYAGNLFNSQVVPPFDDSSIPLVAQYRKDMKDYSASIPSALRDEGYTPSEYSFASLEGYLNAVVFAKAVKMAGKDLTPASFLGSIESMEGVDIGIGSLLNFGLGLVLDDLKKNPHSLSAVLDDTAAHHLDFAQALLGSERAQGWSLNGAHLADRRSAAGLLLIGDAGAMVDPFTAHGIHSAIDAGRMAAELIAESLAKGDWSLEGVLDFDAKWQARWALEMQTGQLLQSLGASEWRIEAIMRYIQRRPKLAALAGGLVGHAFHREALLSLGGARHILRSLA